MNALFSLALLLFHSTILSGESGACFLSILDFSFLDLCCLKVNDDLCSVLSPGKIMDS